MTGARWSLPLAGVGVLAWVDALAGGDLGAGLPGVVAAGGSALLAGRKAPAGPRLAAALVAVVLLAVADQIAAPGQFSLTNDAAFYLIVVGGPAVVGSLLAARARQVARLRERVDDLQRRRAAVLRAARAEEAVRVQQRASLALSDRLHEVIDGIHAVADASRDAAPERLVVVEETARSALADLRDLLGVIGARADDTPSPGGVGVGVAQPAERVDHRPARWDRRDLLLTLAGVPVAVETAGSGHGAVAGNVIAAGLQGLLLPVVRRRPVLGSAALMLVATVQTATLAPVPPLVSWLLPGLLTAYLVGVHPSRHAAVGGLVVAVGGVLVVTWATPAADRATPGLVPGLVMGGLAWWAGRTVAAWERRRRRLSGLAVELTRAEDAESRLAAAAQRAELARELHDAGAHALTVVCLQAGAARRLWVPDPDQATQALDTLLTVAGESLRGLDRSLAASGCHPLPSTFGPADLEMLAGLAQALDLRLEVVVGGEARVVAPAAARTAFQVVREALTNAARHAPRARIRLEIAYTSTTLVLSVTDGGPGTGAPVVATHGSGIGLRGMRERVEAAGGRLDHGPVGGGFRVSATIPLLAKEAARPAPAAAAAAR